MYIEVSYVIYLVISASLTVWVARTLSKNGLLFLVDSFNGNEPLAHSVNHLLVVGFYLINLGYILLALQSDQDLNSARHAIEFVSKKVGVAMFVLGLLHFSNVYVISRWRQRALRRQGDFGANRRPDPDQRGT